MILRRTTATPTPPTPSPTSWTTLLRGVRTSVRISSAIGMGRFRRALQSWIAGRLQRGSCLLVRVGMRAIDYLLEIFLIFLFFQKVSYVKESVTFESDIDECRLHSGKNSCDASFVDGTRQRVFVLTLKIDFGELLVFDHRHFGFVGCRRDE